MRLHVMSDLHLEFGNLRYNEDLNPDVLILAGDIGTGKQAFNWIEIFVPKTLPVIYIAGNHEYYGKNLTDHMEAMRGRAKASDNKIFFLENDTVEIDGQMFIGATLWTDLNLYGNSVKAAVAARFGMNDFRTIGGMSIERWIEMHRETASFFNKTVTPESVVITHYSPHIRSVHSKYSGDELNPCYASNLLDSMPITPKLWIHGHTHTSFDYVEKNTRVICNPRGYVGRELNSTFNPNLIVEI